MCVVTAAALPPLSYLAEHRRLLRQAVFVPPRLARGKFYPPERQQTESHLMPSTQTSPLLRTILLALVVYPTPLAIAQAPRLRIEADASQLHFHLVEPAPPTLNRHLRILQSPAHSGFDGTAKTPPPVEKEIWAGPPTSTVTLPRFANGKDRLFSRFHLATHDSPPSPPQYVTEIHLNTPERPNRVTSKKGITCGSDSPSSPVNAFPRINQNIDIAQLLAHAPTNSPYQIRADDSSIPLNENAVRNLDTAFQRAKKAGQEVTGILLAYQRKKSPLPPPIVHPLAHPDSVPIGPAAFDTATAQGLLTYRAVVGWLAERYGNPESDGGALEGLVIGNEIQSHWSWYHLGNASKHLVLNEYAIAVRIADLATRSRIKGFNIYLSLDHHWRQPAEQNPLHGFSGRDAVDSLNRTFASEGNFPWHVAFHPYPENLFNPAFWNDRTATPDFETPKITFKNIEVLAAYLRQPEFQFKGKTRRIALTEQGFHCPSSADGPSLQAAAFALAWKKVQAIPEIISFLYHRHVDHPHENGLKCGLFEHDGSKNPHGIGARRPIADLLAAAGTDAEAEAFEPSLAILQRANWKSLITPLIPSPAPAPTSDHIVITRLVDLLPDAKPQSLADVSVKKAPTVNPPLSPAIQTHPIPASPGQLTFRIHVPDASPTKHRTVFQTSVLINHPQSTGGTFSVTVNGAHVVDLSPEPGKIAPVEVDLSQWAGQLVTLGLGVHPGRDPAYDWMTWCAPRICLKPSRTQENPVHSGLSHP